MNQRVDILVTLVENTKLSFLRVYHFVFLPSIYKGSYLPTSSPNQMYSGYVQIW